MIISRESNNMICKIFLKDSLDIYTLDKIMNQFIIVQGETRELCGNGYNGYRITPPQ